MYGMGYGSLFFYSVLYIWLPQRVFDKVTLNELSLPGQHFHNRDEASKGAQQDTDLLRLEPTQFVLVGQAIEAKQQRPKERV